MYLATPLFMGFFIKKNKNYLRPKKRPSTTITIPSSHSSFHNIMTKEISYCCHGNRFPSQTNWVQKYDQRELVLLSCTPIYDLKNHQVTIKTSPNRVKAYLCAINIRITPTENRFETSTVCSDISNCPKFDMI